MQLYGLGGQYPSRSRRFSNSSPSNENDLALHATNSIAVFHYLKSRRTLVPWTVSDFMFFGVGLVRRRWSTHCVSMVGLCVSSVGRTMAVIELEVYF